MRLKYTFLNSYGEINVILIQNNSLFSITITGAAAWILDETLYLKEILINGGSHLVVNGSITSVTDIVGDGYSMVHITPYTHVTLNRYTTAHCFIYENAVLRRVFANIVIEEFLYVKGKLETASNAIVSLINPALVYIVAQDISISELTIEHGALLSVLDADDLVFNLRVSRFTVEGTFVADSVDLAGLTVFNVTSTGNVEFNPVDDNEHLGETIEIRGTVTLGNAVSFKRPCEDLIIDNGKLSWGVTATTGITLECRRVLINATFTPGNVNFGSGIEEFTLGNHGVITFTAHGPAYMNGVLVEGTMNVQNYAEFLSKNTTNSAINYFIIKSPSGNVYLNNNDKPAYDTNGIATSLQCSILHVDNLLINGILSAKTLDVKDGIEKLQIDAQGDFTFTPCGDFPIHEIYVSGSMISTGPIKLKGTNLEKVHTFTIQNSGTVHFDDERILNKTWSGSSQIAIETIIIHGIFHAGRVINPIGWNSLTVSNGGAFYFEPDGDFNVDDVYVDGIFRSYKPIVMQSIKFTIQNSGTVHFDDEKILNKTWSGSSQVAIETIIIHGTFHAGRVINPIGWNSLTVSNGGAFYFEPDGDFNVDDVYVDGIFRSYKPIVMQSIKFTIQNSGTVHFDDERISNKTWSGSSQVAIETVSISGTFHAGRMINTISYNSGWNSLSISKGGAFYFEPDDDFIVDHAYVNGIFRSYKPIDILSKRSQQVLDITIGPFGSVRLDSLVTSVWTGLSTISAKSLQMDAGSYFNTGDAKIDTQSMVIDGTFDGYTSADISATYFEVKVNGVVNLDSPNCTIVHMQTIKVFGIVSVRTLDIAEGVQLLHIGTEGEVTFTPCREFKIHELYVNGKMTSSLPMILKGTSLEKVNKITIDSAGVVNFDNNVLASKAWSGSTQLGVHTMEVSGTFHLGRMINRIATHGAWNSLSVLTGGKFYFEPDGDFIVDYVYINGIFRSYKPINILSKRLEQDLTITIGSSGDVRLDSLVTSEWTGLSTISAKSLQMDTGSYLNTGDAKIDTQSMVIDGTLDGYPSTDISATYFEVKVNGAVNLDSPNCTIVHMQTIKVFGILSVRTLDIAEGVQLLHIGTQGEVTFTPCREFKIHELYVNGKMTSSLPMILKGTSLEKVNKITIDSAGVVKFDNNVLASKAWSGSTQLGVHTIEVSGTFHIGRMINRIATNGSWDSFSILSGGKCYFEPDGDFIVDYVHVNGIFRSYKPINVFTKRSEQDLDITIGSSGDVRLDSLAISDWTGLSTIIARSLQTDTGSYLNSGDTEFDLNRMVIGGSFDGYPSVHISAPYFEVTNTGVVNLDSPVCTLVHMEIVKIDGHLTVRTFDIGDGVEDLNIGTSGVVYFTPCREFKIHEIYIDGKMTSTLPVILKGTSLEKVHSFTIDSHGVVKLDNDVLSSKLWSGSSQLGIHSMEVSGIFHVGRMVNRIAENGAWDSLRILAGGEFYFEPDDDFIIDYASLNGIFRAYKPILIHTNRLEQDLAIYVGSAGDIRLDSLITSGWQGLSNITANILQTETSSYVSAGNAKFYITEKMVIGGTLHAYPSKDIFAPYFEVTSTGLVDLSRTVNIDGQTMTVKGHMDVSYQHQPENGQSGCKATTITYESVSVSGTLKAGSVQVNSNTLSVSGTVDVSEGGYKADNGPG